MRAQYHLVNEFWHRKYGYDENHRVVRIAKAADVVEAGTRTDVHLPSPSYWPLVLAAGLPIIGYGLIYNLWLCILGGALVLGGLYGLVFEPVDDPDGGHDHHDDHSSDHDGDGAAAELPESTDASTDATTE